MIKVVSYPNRVYLYHETTFDQSCSSNPFISPFHRKKEINNNQRKHILSPATHCFNHCVFPPLSEDASLLMWGKFILCLSLRWNLQKRQS